MWCPMKIEIELPPVETYELVGYHAALKTVDGSGSEYQDFVVGSDAEATLDLAKDRLERQARAQIQYEAHERIDSWFVIGSVASVFMRSGEPDGRVWSLRARWQQRHLELSWLPTWQ